VLILIKLFSFVGVFNTSEQILAHLEGTFGNESAKIIFDAYENDPNLQNTSVRDLGWDVGGDQLFLADRRNVSNTFAETQAGS
jgi:hypothetical protein